MRKERTISIHYSKSEFKFGNCAILVISSAFGLPNIAMMAILKLLKWKNVEEGLDFWQCKKLIYLLGSSKENRVQYIPNVSGVSYMQMATLYLKGNYIVVFDEHLSHLQNGELYDSYYFYEKVKFKKAIPTGWYKIN